MPSVVWSHSALKEFEQCPRKYHEVRVLKLHPFADTEQIRYGKELHKAAEDYIGDGLVLPPQFEFIKPTLDALVKKPGRKLVEHQMALTEYLKPCDWKHPQVWLRGVADLLIIDDENLTARVIDYKTGSNKYPDRDQLELMSLMVFAHFPHIRRVMSALLFVVKNDMVRQEMTVDQADAGWWDYRNRVARIAAAKDSNVWNPKQSPLCGWCPCTGCEHHPKH